MRSWLHDYRQGPAPFQVLGRPVLRAAVAERNQVIALIAELSPSVGVPTLQACFPSMPRAELADIVQRYRRLWRLRNYEAWHVLDWQTPGRVWAMDFAQAPRPIALPAGGPRSGQRPAAALAAPCHRDRRRGPRRPRFPLGSPRRTPGPENG